LQPLGFVGGRKGKGLRVLAFLILSSGILILLLLTLLLGGFGTGLAVPVSPVGLVGVVDGH